MIDDDSGLEQNFGSYDRADPCHLAHIEAGDSGKLPVVLEERFGRQLWVRALEHGDPRPIDPIMVLAGDIVVPFTPIHSTSINTVPIVEDVTGFVISIPVIEVHRDDNDKVVFARTRRVAGPFPANRRLPVGYQLTFQPDGVVLELDWVDQMFPPGPDGYAPLTNTIWTWMTSDPAHGSEALTRYVLAAARRLDTAHRSFERIHQRLDTFDANGPGPVVRLEVFEIVGDLETAVVALSRANDMAMQVGGLATITTPIPSSLTQMSTGLTKIRDAYEHIGDRAQGNVNRKPDSQQALTIFDWTSMLAERVVAYADERLALADVPQLFLDTRTFLKAAASEGKVALAHHVAAEA